MKNIFSNALLLVLVICFYSFSIPVRLYDQNERTLVLESNGGVPVNIQDQTSPTELYYFLTVSGKTTTLDTNAVINTYSVPIKARADSGIVKGDQIYIANLSRDFYCTILDTSADTAFLDSPLPYAFPKTGTVVQEVSSNMNVDGSTTRKTFVASLPVGTSTRIDITGIRIVLNDGTTMDGGTFGGGTALTRGVVIRKVNASGVYYHLGNFKTNGDFATLWNNHAYDTKAPSGEYQFISTWKIGGQDNQGVALRLTAGDKIEIIIQDNLTGQTSFRAVMYGHDVAD